jgi:putative addiction module killer protein
MIVLRKTAEFEKWFQKLKDEQIRDRIVSRLMHLEEGRAGDHKFVAEGVWELRLHFGPGYRLYYTPRGQELILLLAGGDKDSQDKDIRLALKLAKKG